MMVAVAAVGEDEATRRVRGRGLVSESCRGNPYFCNIGGARGTVREEGECTGYNQRGRSVRGVSLVRYKTNDSFCYYVNHTRNTVAYWWFAQDKLPCQTIKMYSFPEIFHII